MHFVPRFLYARRRETAKLVLRRFPFFFLKEGEGMHWAWAVACARDANEMVFIDPSVSYICSS
jgi:hypothetical protein